MCLILFAHDTHPDYALVFAANRDEFYDRPTAEADFWDEAPHVLGGRDLKSEGTWMGVTRSGHWAAVTNVRDQSPHRPDAPSRGHLVAEYLKEEPAPRRYLEALTEKADAYNGFNLLLGTPGSVWCYSNRVGTVRTVEPGVHGISNAHLNDPWPKVRRGRSRLRAILEEEDSVSPDRLLDLLDDREPAPDDELPETGLSKDRERMLSPPFIEGAEYGTRSSTVLLMDRAGQVTFVERTFDRGTPAQTREFSFELVSAPSA